MHDAGEVVAVDAIAITEQKARRGVPWESLSELLASPSRRRVLGDVAVQHASAVMGEDDEDVVERKDLLRRFGYKL